MVTMREAREQYLEQNHFSADGGNSEAWVKFELGPIPLVFPNTDSRRIAVPYHDLHHVLTGYRANTIGEFEISAWEVASGCGKYVAAWFINLGGMMTGLVSSPRRVWAAFVRGRHSKNLYSQAYEPLLSLEVSEVRQAQGLGVEVRKGSVVDGVALLGAVALGVAMWLPAIALMPLLALPWFIARRRYLRSLRELEFAGLAGHDRDGLAAGEHSAHQQ